MGSSLGCGPTGRGGHAARRPGEGVAAAAGTRRDAACTKGGGIRGRSGRVFLKSVKEQVRKSRFSALVSQPFGSLSSAPEGQLPRVTHGTRHRYLLVEKFSVSHRE